jgi:uncharacterized protein with GYD domain
MALALVLGKLSPEATKGLLKQGLAAREEYFRGLAEPRGVKVHGYYFAEGGEWDVVVLLDTGDDTEAGAVAATFTTQATGMYTNYRVVRLYAPGDVDAALGNAISVRAPGT